MTDWPDPQQVLMELRDLTRLIRESPEDPVIAGALGSVLKRAKKLKFYPGMPHEAELREAFSELCFFGRDWQRTSGVMLYGPDVAEDRARTLEIAGHLLTMTAGEVAWHRLTRELKF